MNKFIISLLFMTIFPALKGEEYIETYGIVSEEYNNDIQDVPIVRYINGGTVIIPEFDETCPEEMKAPFSYACKIVEEYMPPTLPLRVKVSCGRVGNSSAGIISKVSYISKENFGDSPQYNNASLCAIKGLILGELAYNSAYTYLKYVPDIDFLTARPDIEIVYNIQKLNELSFSLHANPEDKYDFVSVAIRDILKGLGISHSYTYNPVDNILNNPSEELIPFETLVESALGNQGNPKARFARATQGALALRLSNGKSLNLYAPSTWQNGVSLNYFIPQEDCCLTQILTYSFCKGMVTRALSDDYAYNIFYDLLGRRPIYHTGSSTPTPSTGGNTSMVMPYNGSISFNENPGIGLDSYYDSTLSQNIINVLINNDDDDDDYMKHRAVEEYVDLFHPYQGNMYDLSEGATISVLKKDGNWDLVQFINYHVYDLTFNMADWEFHHDESEYARTVDGYLRVRVTTKNIEYGRVFFKSTFFVLDYLPQKVKLSHEFIDEASPAATLSTNSKKTVRIYFGNTEGITRLILERLVDGARLPGRISISDIKKGYYETTIDRNTTFTAIGYNENGTSRGVPLTIHIPSEESGPTMTFKLKNNYISIKSMGDSAVECTYTLTSLDLLSVSQGSLEGVSTAKIDISNLPSGLYLLTVNDITSGATHTFKFKR